MVEMVSVRYKSLDASLLKHVGQIAGLVKHLANMGAPLKGALTIKMLVATVEVQQIFLVTAWIWTFAEKDSIW